MQTLLTTDYEDNVGRLEMSQAPEIGDEVMVLDGDKSATWEVVGRRWCAPHWGDSVKWDQYLVLKVKLVEGSRRVSPRGKRSNPPGQKL